MGHGGAAGEAVLHALPINCVRSDSWARQVEVGAYMEDLQGFVFDEAKCVTYKWLSITLGVSADVSKRMLYEFAEAHSAKVSAIYLVRSAQTLNPEP